MEDNVEPNVDDENVHDAMNVDPKAEVIDDTTEESDEIEEF